ncbi:MAG: GNAT family protein [Roseiflexaceae bacterium]|nr:GNAT family protein [Roseiflexaceae bacterium]
MINPSREPEKYPIVVPGERIFLSTIQRSDLPLYTRWFADLELSAYLGAMGTAFMAEHEEDWYNSVVRATDSRTFAMIVRDGLQPIGSVSLSHINTRPQVAELGIAIGEKSAWGQGYGTEAVRLMTDYGFTFLNLHTIYLWHAGFNERGHRAYLKAGFKEAGRLRGARVFNGKRYDDILMDVTREEFGPSRLTGLLGQIQE